MDASTQSGTFALYKTLDPSEGPVVSSILQIAGQRSPSHRKLMGNCRREIVSAFFDSILGPISCEGVNQTGSEFWSIKNSAGEIQSIMTFTSPGKSYDYQSFKNSCRSWVFNNLPSHVQSWGSDELVPKDKELKQSLGFDTEDAIEMTYIATKPDAQRQGYAECLIRELQVLSRESGLPIWLVADNPESVQMYHKLGFKETKRVNLDMGGGEISTQTAFAYIPN